MQRETTVQHKKAVREMAVLMELLKSPTKRKVCEYRDYIRRVLTVSDKQLRLSVDQAIELVKMRGVWCLNPSDGSGLLDALDGIRSDLANPKYAKLIKANPELESVVINNALRRTDRERASLQLLRSHLAQKEPTARQIKRPSRNDLLLNGLLAAEVAAALH